MSTPGASASTDVCWKACVFPLVLAQTACVHAHLADALIAGVDPMVPPEQFAEEYTRIAEANFTVLLGGFGATTPTTVPLQIAAAKASGLAAVSWHVTAKFVAVLFVM